MKRTLYSLNPEEYPNIKIDFIETTAKGARNFSNGEIIKAKKTAIVQAERLKEDTVVDTRVRTIIDGKTYVFDETKNIAPAGAIVITNPDGEQYVIKDKQKDDVVITALEQFESKYTRTENGFLSTEGARNFLKLNEHVTFTASWGEQMFAPAGSMLCIEYGEGEEYSVTNSAFASTYKKIELAKEIDPPAM